MEKIAAVEKAFLSFFFSEYSGKLFQNSAMHLGEPWLVVLVNIENKFNISFQQPYI